jgi:hypothetical protein
VAGRIRSIEKPNDIIWNRTCDLLACSIVPQPTMLPRAPRYSNDGAIKCGNEGDNWGGNGHDQSRLPALTEQDYSTDSIQYAWNYF